MKNLPLECGIEQLLEFLGVHSQHIVQQGVHMILNSQVNYNFKEFSLLNHIIYKLISGPTIR